MSDPYQPPGLSPGHLGAPAAEPVGFEPSRRPDGPRRIDPRRLHNGLACGLSSLGLALVLALAALAGYRLWPHGSAAPPDFAGGGSGTVQVSVAQGASLTQIGKALTRNGVVASVKAFTQAAAHSPAGDRIQPGTYTLKLRMSAANALNVLLDPANANALTIPEGWRAEQVYAAIDTRLKLPPGTARTTAQQHVAELGLPDVAKGRPEGFLYPAGYPVTDGSTALGMLQQMVGRALGAYQDHMIQEAAASNGVSLYTTVVIASLAQAEADNPDDMARVARVIYNRLAKGLPLQLDSTINYALGRTSITTNAADTKVDSPYNTYLHPGLPPSPIGNPGRDALRAATRPADGDWLYFVTVRPGDTRFTDSAAQHDKDVAEFNAYQAQHGPSAPASAGKH